jgi:hypothetical protein
MSVSMTALPIEPMDIDVSSSSRCKVDPWTQYGPPSEVPALSVTIIVVPLIV